MRKIHTHTVHMAMAASGRQKEERGGEKKKRVAGVRRLNAGRAPKIKGCSETRVCH